jgi:hypothetical protein
VNNADVKHNNINIKDTGQDDPEDQNSEEKCGISPLGINNIDPLKVGHQSMIQRFYRGKMMLKCATVIDSSCVVLVQSCME